MIWLWIFIAYVAVGVFVSFWIVDDDLIFYHENKPDWFAGAIWPLTFMMFILVCIIELIDWLMGRRS